MVRAARRLFSFNSHAPSLPGKALKQLSLSLILFNLRIPGTHTRSNIYLFGLAQELKSHLGYFGYII